MMTPETIAKFIERERPDALLPTVGGQTALQRRRGNSVLVHAVAARDGAQLLDIKIRVLDFQRIKRPLDQLEATGKRVVTLEKLDTPAQSSILMLLAHGQHMRMQVGMAAAGARY